MYMTVINRQLTF